MPHTLHEPGLSDTGRHLWLPQQTVFHRPCRLQVSRALHTAAFLPQKRAGATVECVEFVVIEARTDEDDPSRSHDWSSVVFRASVLRPLCRQVRVLAERNLPKVFTGIEIDRVQSAPWRSDGGIVIRIEKLSITCKAVLRV